jgi:toxin ParE1/3/4
MYRRIEISRRASQDLREHYRYIHRDNPDAAERFLTAAWETFLRLADMPGIGWRWRTAEPGLARVRVTRVDRPFERYLVFFRDGRSRVRLLAVLHASQDLEIVPTVVRRY